MRYFRKIVGNAVYLSPVNPEDIPLFTKWSNEPEAMTLMSLHHFVYRLDSTPDTITRLPGGEYKFTIVRESDNEPLGYIFFEDVDFVNRTAMVGLFIGEAENRDKGYGSEALSLMVAYGFHTLGLHNVMLWVHADNAKAIASYKKAGFSEIGRRRGGVFKNGQFLDMVFMDITASGE
jgi:RimJ/RimL family protein N-acetyltransferase